MGKENLTAFVTGATGLLGSRLVSDLLQSGRKVIALKRVNSDTKLVKGLNQNNFQWCEGDVTDIYSLLDGMKYADEVYHCAAAVDFDTRKTSYLYKVNVEGTANVVNAALEREVKKFCHASSIATLGRPQDKETLTEDYRREVSKKSIYAITKFQAEREVWRGIAEGLNAAIVNPVIIIGPGDWKNDSSRIISLIANGLKFFTRGNVSLVNVRDVSAVMIKLMDGNIFGERFIVSSGDCSYSEFFKLITDCLGLDPPDFELKKWMLEIAWRADALKSFMFNEPHIITKEISEALFKNYTISNKKITERLNYNFMSLKDSIDEVCKEYLKQEIQLF